MGIGFFLGYGFFLMALIEALSGMYPEPEWLGGFWGRSLGKFLGGLLGLMLTFFIPMLIVSGFSKLDEKFGPLLLSTGSRHTAAWGVAKTIVR